MKRVECFQSDNGHLEKSLDRVKAHDLVSALPSSQSNPNAKILDWSQCLRIMENADVVMVHLQEFIEARDALTAEPPTA